ncbi:MAG: NCS2 family permease [Myxococcota bacterium]|nr:NCS2 family permease [Myxococcota bacterium]
MSNEFFERRFSLRANGTTLSREVRGGTVTFFAMAYIIFVQPAILSGEMLGVETGLDFGAVMVATCLTAALATAIMALYARYPIAQAPGMGENFFFVVSVIPAAAALGYAEPGLVALGCVFFAGLVFLLLSLTGLRVLLVDAIPPVLKHSIAVGVGLFIGLIGLENGRLIEVDKTLSMNVDFASPDLGIFFGGLFITSILVARRTPGAIAWGIALTTGLAIGLKLALVGEGMSGSVASSELAQRFEVAESVFSSPPSLAPTFLKMDLVAAFSASMIPFILVLLVMDVFDTMGTLVAVGERAGFMRGNRLPRARQAMLSDAVGTTLGACLGTSTVTSFVESAAGVEEGARTGLAGLVTASLFLLALFVSPGVEMVASYPPITAPALVVVGSLMLGATSRIDWSEPSEALPAFLTVAGIPLTYSIADGLALGIVSYALVKLASGRNREVHWLVYLLAILLVPYYVVVRGSMV